MESEAPKSDQEHDDSRDNKCGEPCHPFKKWIRDPNGWIAICTIILVLIGLRALHVSEDTEKKQLRAYVGPLIQNSEIKNSAVSATVFLENFGETPAKKCNISSDFGIFPFPLPKGFVFKIPARFEQTAMIYPKAVPPTRIEPIKAFTAFELVEVRAPNPQHAVYFFGVLNYTDVFNDIHSTMFCYFLNPYSAKIISKDKTGIITTFKWTECDQHNDFN